MKPIIHIFTHTHWDREWFLPAALVNEWLADLFERLFALIEVAPDYRYVLDGQTMILEDYLDTHPAQRVKIQELAKAGNLLIGPYYGQNDWRAVSEESLMRNVYYGLSDARQLGNQLADGWLLDNFGHASQSPQIHTIFGLEDVFVWRGPVFPRDELMSDFFWEAPDGSRVLAHFFISGYRNFYNLADTAEFIGLRVEQLIAMLSPYAPHGQLVFLDGYDTDAWPEDPFQYLSGQEADFVRSTPEQYSAAVRSYAGLDNLPVLQGELYSGKYASIFPGSLSARTYLRIQNAQVERLLSFYVDPLIALLPVERSGHLRAEAEDLWRDLLKTHLHDNIGGVSVDQVHDSMEQTYRRLYDRVREMTPELLGMASNTVGLKAGRYAMLPSPYLFDRIWLHGPEGSYRVSSHGSGFWPVEESVAKSGPGVAADTFTWQNKNYDFKISRDGAFLNGASVGNLLLEEDRGDTYSADPKPIDPHPEIQGGDLHVLEETDEWVRLTWSREISWGDVQVRTEEELILDQSPLIQWRLVVDTRGTHYRLRFTYDTGDTESRVFAKMPFTIEQRNRTDANYFGVDVPDHLKPVLLAAREVDSVSDFPFQGFVALSSTQGTRALLARGLREYQVDAAGTLMVTLKRSVEWLARRQLKTRLGDAGPYMYVPAAKDERQTQIELGLLTTNTDAADTNFLKWFYLFEQGFVVFDNNQSDGHLTKYSWWQREIPWCGLQPVSGGPNLLRVYNPTDRDLTLGERIEETDPHGIAIGWADGLGAYQIKHLEMPSILRKPGTKARTPAPKTIVEFPGWPTGPDRSIIEESKIVELQSLIESLEAEQKEAERRLTGISARDEPLHYHRTRHKIIRLSREILEARLSILLNRWKQAPKDKTILNKVKSVGKQLNLVRRQRRTYDYILSVFEDQARKRKD